MLEISDEALAAEVDRAVRETRATLNELGKRHCLTPALMGLTTLLDKIEIAVTRREGDSSFEFVPIGSDIAVHFRVGILRKIYIEVAALTAEIGDLEEEESRRPPQTAINLFVVHELMHIRQNFPDFSTVPIIKAGLPGIGLPVFDLVADIISAWVCAHVEAARLGALEHDDVLPTFVNTLALSYMIGAFVFDGRTNPGKRQRLLGLVISALLAKAKSDGSLRTDHVLNTWRPTSPVLVVDIAECRAFNAMVVDEMSGLLLGVSPSDSSTIEAFWESVGERPILRTFELGAILLKQGGAIR